MQFLKPSWEDIEKDCDKLAEAIAKSGFKPTLIIGIARGGMIPAVILSDRLDVHPLSLIQSKLYVGEAQRGKFELLEWPSRALEGQKVLVVDDVSDTGHTLQKIEEKLRGQGVEYKVACLHCKPHTTRAPDFYASSTDKWIHYPWNKNENKRK